MRRPLYGKAVGLEAVIAYFRQNNTTMEIIDKLGWIEIRDGAILMARSKGKDTFYVPGGKREAGETDEQALAREVSEELSVEIVGGTLKFVGIFQAQAHGKPEGVQVKMTCYQAQYAGDIAAAAEIEDIRWMRYDDKHEVAPVDKLVFDFLKRKNILR